MYTKIIRVSDVELIESTQKVPKSFDSKMLLSDSINECTKTSGSVLAHYQNSAINYKSGFSFAGAFLHAYNTHGDVGLSPDDIWFQILSWVTKYIDSNAETLRSKFVEHSDQKFLSVTTPLGVGEEKWEDFFDLMREAIKGSTMPGVVEALESNFTTTGVVESMLSVGTIMSGFAKYFKYGRCIPMCGIRHVLYTGTLEDWVGLQAKLEGLKQFVATPGDALDIYINELVPVIEKFISTYQGNPNKEFWDKVFNLKHGRLGSGSTTYATGWVLKFYGIYGETELSDLKNDFIKVDIKLDNKCTGIKKMVQFYGGFGGISRIKDEQYDIYKPQQSFIIYHDGNIIET
jgi:hypothetical protein